MPFGLANAPAIFQAYINRALAGYVNVFYVVYLNNILIYLNFKKKYLKYVVKILNRLRQFTLFANLKKCEFSIEKVEFLGFIVSIDSVSINPRRVASIKEWPVSTSFREVQVFLGFTNFYRRFIAKYFKIASPLTGLLYRGKNGKHFGPFRWPTEAKNTFRQLIDAFTTAFILIYFDPSRKSKMETDALK